jgi:tetratricopeptide (TPR) repeat protein
MALRAAFRQLSPGQYDQMVQQISRGIGYQGTTSHAEVSKPEDTAQPLTMTYDYKREKNGDWDNLKIVAQLAPAELPQIDEKEPPVQALSLGIPHVDTSTSAMKLPEGWGAVLPDAIHTKSAYATFDESYRLEKGTVYAERRIEVLTEKVPVSEWKVYKKWIDDWDLTNDRWVQLVTNDNKAAIEGKATTVPSNREAAKLVQSAYDAIGRRDIGEAKSDLDQAKELNSDQAYLWSTYGYYHYQLGAMMTAIEDYRKELTLHPERVDVYRNIVAAEGSLNQKKEMKDTLTEWAALDTRDPVPPMTLAALLLQEGDAAAAVTASETAVQRLSKDSKFSEQVQLILGEAQLKAEMREKGRDTLLALMQTTSDPLQMNNCAYALAEAGQELPADEAATRKAIEKWTEESKGWTLDENPQTLSAKSRSLIATWDTLGWVLYREGKLDEAEGYLKAAWVNVQSDLMAEHLGAVAEARGKKDDALTAYVLGIAASRPGDEQKKLQGRADALRKAGAKTSINDAHNKLQEDRKIPLGAAKGMNGVVEYRLLLNDGKVVRAVKAGADDLQKLPGGEDRLKEAKLVGLWPTGSQASLVRNGMLNCHSGVCELVLIP